jgi:hypothetical protein
MTHEGYSIGDFSRIGFAPSRQDVFLESESMKSERHERGLARLKGLNGEAGERVVDSLKDIAPDLGTYIVEFVFGDVYCRPGLSDL